MSSQSIKERLANGTKCQTKKGNVPTLSIKCAKGETPTGLLATVIKALPKGSTGAFATNGYVVVTFNTTQERDAYHASLAHLRTGSTRPTGALTTRTVFGLQTEADALSDALDCDVVSNGNRHFLTLTAPQLAAFTAWLGWNKVSYDVNSFGLTTAHKDNDANRVSLEAHDQAVALAEEEAGRKAIEHAQATALAHMNHDADRCKNTKKLVSSATSRVDSPITQSAMNSVAVPVSVVNDVAALMKEMAAMKAANAAVEASNAAAEASIATKLHSMREEHAALVARQSQLKVTQEALQAAAQVVESA